MSSVDDNSVDDIIDTGELTDSNDVISDNSSEPSAWHSDTFGKIRQLWYEHKMKRETKLPPNPRGRPKGSINRSKRAGGN